MVPSKKTLNKCECKEGFIINQDSKKCECK